MPKRASIKKEECPTCRGNGFIEVEIAKLFNPETTRGYPTAKGVLAYLIGFLILSPALLGIYWEIFLPKGRP
jgi:hypothetical protein